MSTTADAPASVHVEHALAVDTERMIQRARVVALLLSIALLASFGSDRSLRITLAVALLGVTTFGVHRVLRRSRGRRVTTWTGWVCFAGDVAVCAVALSAVADDPVDPVSLITLIVAIEAATRWSARGAVLGGLVAGVLEVGWAMSGYAAIGRELPAPSIGFRLLAPVVIALPVGLLIERLRRQREYTRRLFEHANDAMVVVAGDRVVDANPAAARLAGVPTAHLVGEPFTARMGPILEVDDTAALLDGPRDRPPVPLTTAAGQVRWLAVDVEAADDAGLVFVVVRDVTADRAREDELRFHARHDPLTGLPNRAAMRALLRHRLVEGVGVVFLDLDDFKRVNDQYGHQAGDDLLVEVADRLREVTRDVDVAHRWAGDEFCLVVAEASEDLLAMMAQRITRAFQHPFTIGDHRLAMRASIGTAIARDGDTEDGLVARADRRMYGAKRPVG